MTSSTVSQRLARYIHDLRFEDIAPEAVEKAKDHLAYQLGQAFGGCYTDVGAQAIRVARAFGGGRGRCTVIGASFNAPPLDATLAHGSLMHALGMDDVLLPAGVHIGLVTQPVALALGEDLRRSGRDVLTAIVAGYDVVGKLAGNLSGWNASTPRRPTIMWGTIAAATVAAKMLRLDVDQTAHAMGYAANTAMGVPHGEFPTHYYGLLARLGLTGTLLVQLGAVADSEVFEAEFGFYRTFFGHVPDDLDASLATLGQRFAIMNATTKRYSGTGADSDVFPSTDRLRFLSQDGERLIGAERVALVAEIIGRLETVDEISELMSPLACAHSSSAVEEPSEAPA